MTEQPEGAGLLDTSVFVAQEAGRTLGTLPTWGTISVVTAAELRLGVLLADDPEVRARRLETLARAEARFEPLPITSGVAAAFAEIVAQARRAGRRPKIMDAWIAATAVSHSLPVYTQDADFDQIPRVRVVKV